MQSQVSDKSESEPVVAGLVDFIETESPSMQALEAAVRELSQSEMPILLSGEAGTGKRMMARRIHDCSPRSAEQFTVVACENLRAEDIYGGQGDIFSGRGTVFFEEVAALSLPCQASFLDELTKLEGDGNRRLQGRFICATARDLESQVRSRLFREDLYYHINGVCLRLPPLRQRKEDILPLMNFFFSKYASQFCCPAPALSEETQQLFYSYSWPGNLKELQQVAKAVVVLGDESLAMRGLRATLLKSDRVQKVGEISLKEAGRAAFHEAQKEIILEALTRARWNRRRAAKELKISYRSLLYKLKQIGPSELVMAGNSDQAL
jgi:two-component system, NtrC family, response regulator AtoC